jgi:acetolactate synthase-1/3 small subunit
MSDNLRHIIAALVTNEPGVLAQVAGMFAARGFNIDSLVVGRTENPELSRMTIVVAGNPMQFEQVKKQLQKLVPVVKVVAYSDVAHVERDLMLIQVSTIDGDKNRRSEIIEVANIFRAKVVDISTDRVMIELSGTEEKIEAFIELLRPFGIIELARTGIIAMPRGAGGPGQAMRAIRKSQQENSSASDIDPASLPPG